LDFPRCLIFCSRTAAPPAARMLFPFIIEPRARARARRAYRLSRIRE
jgi:hypothetical protein